MPSHPLRRALGRALAPGLLAAALFAFPVSPAIANPAMDVARDFTQPDGTTLTLRLWGDEFANGWRTRDGYSVLRDPASGYWVYAELDATGALVPTTSRAGIDAPTTAPRLRPTDEALQQSFERYGVIKPGVTAPQAAPPWASGATNVLVIMVQFPGDAGDANGPQPAVPASFSAAQMQANLFGATPTGPGNMTDYYDEVSYGALNLVGTVVGPFTVAHDKDDYDDGPSDEDALVTEAIALADPSVDFAPFDNDGNGQVDFVAICYAGNGPDNGLYDGANSNTNNLWPHAGSIASVNVDGGARSVTQYFMAPELLSNAPRLRTIGVYAHELGHKLGLPDLYDTDGSSNGVGHWCLMGTGSWNSDTPGSENGESPAHMSAWCKYHMGWLSPVDRTGLHVDQAFPQAETNAFAVRLLANPGGADWVGTGEYFLIENRQQTGFDVGLDGCGLLVWHIDEARSNNAGEGHTAATHRLVDLEEANGTPQNLDLQPPDPPTPGAPGNNRGDAGDPFPGSTDNRRWNAGTTPSALLYSGAASNQRMAVMTAACAATMTARLGPNAAPVADAGADIVAECASPTTTGVQLDGTGSSDADGDALTYSWSAPGVVFDDPTASQPTGQFPSGVTLVTLTVSDGVDTDTDEMLVQVLDTTPPLVVCPADITVECSAPGGTPADDPQLAPFFAGFSATDICDASLTVGDDAPPLFPVGQTIVTFTAMDDAGNSASCSAVVRVADTTPPVVTLELDRYSLWPPNHKLADITADVTATDVCDPNPVLVLLAITSDEPTDGLGDGDTAPDVVGADLGTLDTRFQLRSERSGTGDGRHYTITYRATDDSGNSADAVAVVCVPHDRAGLAHASVGFLPGGAGIDPAAREVAVVLTSFRIAEGEAVVVPGDPYLSATDGGQLLQATAVDAPAIDVTRAYAGHVGGTALPHQTWTSDVDQDGMTDLVLFYDAGALRRLAAEAGPENGALGLHFIGQDGEQVLIPDLFALGEPVAPAAAVDAGDRGTGTPGTDLQPSAGGTGTVSPESQATPGITRLAGIVPNPFRGATTIALDLAVERAVSVRIYNLQGALVHELAAGVLPAGRQTFAWDGRDGAGRRLAAGVYLVRVQAGEFTAVRKAIVLE